MIWSVLERKDKEHVKSTVDSVCHTKNEKQSQEKKFTYYCQYSSNLQKWVWPLDLRQSIGFSMKGSVDITNARNWDKRLQPKQEKCLDADCSVSFSIFYIKGKNNENAPINLSKILTKKF